MRPLNPKPALGFVFFSVGYSGVLRLSDGFRALWGSGVSKHGSSKPPKPFFTKCFWFRVSFFC